jgi:hypothetical protein
LGETTSGSLVIQSLASIRLASWDERLGGRLLPPFYVGMRLSMSRKSAYFPR